MDLDPHLAAQAVRAQNAPYGQKGRLRWVGDLI
jgi:hypothetical protein